MFSKENEKIICSADAERYNPDSDMGLTSSQIEKRTEDGYINAEVNKTTKTTWQIVRSNLFTYFNLIFFVLAVVLLLVGSYKNLTFLIVVVVNTVIGIIQEIRSKKTLEKLTLVSAPITKVIRDGKTESINSDELVLDDIVIFEAGNQICADAVVCDGELSVNESLVTGESDEIRKRIGDTLLSGSFVVSGSCRARLDKVGAESFAAKLTVDAKKIKKKQQPGMMKSLTLLIKIIGIIIVPLAIIMFLNQKPNMELKKNVETMSAAVIGMIPEGLYLLTTVALAVSVIRLAKKKTLVHDLKCIETLARVDVICVDKTGTVTEPEMHVSEIVPIDDNENSLVYANHLIRDYVLNMTSDNITMAALKAHFDDKKSYRRAEAIKGFSSATKYSAVSFGREHYVLGAPEFVLQGDYNNFRDIIEQHSSMGERVLVFAEYCIKRDSENIFENGDLSGLVVPIALVTLVNRIRPEAKETFKYFTEQGVAIKVISGDNPITVSKAAAAAGIPGSDKYIDASLLNTKEKIAKGVLEYNVFGRVTPEQKRLFIRALKRAGHTVAMTGDGVNDVLALKDADCSIAMASGSDAAANVSDLVLLDSNFASMPSVVAEGRRVINNIQRSASLFLMKNISTFILTVFAIILAVDYPFQPIQISLLSALMIGIPSFFLALEPNHDIVRGKFLRNVMFNAFPAALTSFILVCWSMLFIKEFSIEPSIGSTLSFYLYSFVAYMMLFKVCKPMNLLHKILFGLMGILFVFAAALFPELFGLTSLSGGAMLIFSALFLLSFPINRMIQVAFDSFGAWKQHVRDYVKKDIEEHKK